MEKRLKIPVSSNRGRKHLQKLKVNLSKLAKGTKERSKTGKAVAKIHERIRNQRKDFCHKETRKIVDQYQYICMEDLRHQKMMEGSHFAKSITDASWNQFHQFLTYKAAEAGRKLGVVNPALHNQICCNVGTWSKKSSRIESNVVPNVGMWRTGISMQRKIFWPSD